MNMIKLLSLWLFLWGYSLQAAEASLLAKIVKFPPEVSLDAAIAPDLYGRIQLQEDHIALLQNKYYQNFSMRHYLRYASRALQVGLLGASLYQLGFFDYLLSFKKNYVNPNPKSTVDEIAFLKEEIKKIHDVMDPAKFQHDKKMWESFGKKLWEGAKSMSAWVTLSVCVAKVTQINNYVETQPTFNWFFGHHSMVDYVEMLKKSFILLMHPQVPEYVKEQHRQNIEPTLQSLARNLTEFIAFMNFYLDTIDSELLHNNNMDTQARYLFNVSNDFFAKIGMIIKNEAMINEALPTLDSFKSDLVDGIKRCQLFENEMLQQS